MQLPKCSNAPTISKSHVRSLKENERGGWIYGMRAAWNFLVAGFGSRAVGYWSVV